MRDYSRFDGYLNRLCEDIYPQPADDGHLAWAECAIGHLRDDLGDMKTVLDVGCGTGFCSDVFQELGLVYKGITASPEDRRQAKKNNVCVSLGDMTYLPNSDGSIDLVFARHVLEHSPFPIITLMEWWRVSRRYLYLVAPAPDYWGYAGKNHYSVAGKAQLEWWLNRAGWQISGYKTFTTKDEMYIEFNPTYNQANVRDVEYWLLCEKSEPIRE